MVASAHDCGGQLQLQRAFLLPKKEWTERGSDLFASAPSLVLLLFDTSPDVAIGFLKEYAVNSTLTAYLGL